MLRRFRKMLRSFKSQILLSFFAFIRIFLVWICVYFVINKQQNDLIHFTKHLTALKHSYSESNRYLQNFILNGYHQPGFYTTGKQRDIDLFFAGQDSVNEKLKLLAEEAASNHIRIDSQLANLITLHKQFADTVTLLKHIYLLKGFKDCGTEGIMRRYAHFLEDSTNMEKMEILTLRRREKDFMLREENEYIDDVNKTAEAQIKKFSGDSVTLTAIKNYQAAFNDFAHYTVQLGVDANQGIYGHMERVIDRLDKQYIATDAKVAKEVTRLNNMFKLVLLISFLLLLGAAIYLSIVLSNNLTKDIKKLNKNVAALINSGFKDHPDVEPLHSKITEIQELNDDFIALRGTLIETFAQLEFTIAEEKMMSAELHKVIEDLQQQISELKKDK